MSIGILSSTLVTLSCPAPESNPFISLELWRELREIKGLLSGAGQLIVTNVEESIPIDIDNNEVNILPAFDNNEENILPAWASSPRLQHSSDMNSLKISNCSPYNYLKKLPIKESMNGNVLYSSGDIFFAIAIKPR
jgi:hypothetical protein